MNVTYYVESQNYYKKHRQYANIRHTETFINVLIHSLVLFVVSNNVEVLKHFGNFCEVPFVCLYCLLVREFRGDIYNRRVYSMTNVVSVYVQY
jgi:hypothetical protein